MVNHEGELVQYSFYAYIEPVSATGVLKASRWMKVMVDEMKSIEMIPGH